MRRRRTHLKKIHRTAKRRHQDRERRDTPPCWKKHSEKGAAPDVFPRAFSDRPITEVEIPSSNNFALENLPRFSEKVSTWSPEFREKNFFRKGRRGKMENYPSFHIALFFVPSPYCEYCWNCWKLKKSFLHSVENHLLISLMSKIKLVSFVETVGIKPYFSTFELVILFLTILMITRLKIRGILK